MSDTPRTDAVEDEFESRYSVLLSHARNLERELTAERSKRTDAQLKADNTTLRESRDAYSERLTALHKYLNNRPS